MNGLENVTANAEEVVTPQSENNEMVEPETTTETAETTEPQIVETETTEEVTQTQAFAKRLREEKTKAEAEAKDKVISEMYGEQYGIHTYEDYQKAMKEQEKQEREDAIRQEYENKGLPDDLLNELVLSKQERLEREAEKQSQQAKQFVDRNRLDFLDWYQSENGKAFDTKTDSIPDEVWKQSELYESTQGKQGKSLMDAYAHYEIKQLKSKLSAQEVNKINAESSTGSVTGNGSVADKPLTAEMVNAMSPKDLARRWDEVKKIFNMK